MDENNVGLTATASDTLELRFWLHCSVDEVLVVRPAGLRHEFREMAVNLREYHAGRVTLMPKRLIGQWKPHYPIELRLRLLES